MPLAAGTRFGSYEIKGAVGAGGMGEVYRARDTRLGRDAAIKVLPESLANDPERLARFEREAQVLAALNHPNIAAIYGMEGRALVMEFVDGEDLSDRIAGAPMPVAEVVPIARQIAEALEAAHDQGIIHRDLKPANIKVRADGTVKVLDFGLAKAFDVGRDLGPGGLADPANSPTLTTPFGSALGMILGTAAYMSPEQARGKAVDRRADVWAFGVVLCEMMTGRPLFARDSVAETLGAVFEQPIPPDDLPALVPPALRRLLARCLDRDPRSRLRDIGEARILLSRPEAMQPAPGIGPPPHGPRVLWWAVAALLVALAAGASWMLKPLPPTNALPIKLDIIANNLQTGLNPHFAPALSPDGTRVLFTAGNRLWVRRLDSLDAEEITGSDGAWFCAWAPQGDAFVFVRQNQVWVSRPGSGAPTAIAAMPDGMDGSGGAAWNEADEIALSGSPTQGIVIVSPRGGASRVALAVDHAKESDFHEISALPAGYGWVFTVHRLAGTDTVAVLTGTTRKDVLHVAGATLQSPVYSPTGHLIYQQAQVNPGLWAVRFSLDRLEIEGAPVLISAGGSQPSVAKNGTLAFVRKPDATHQLVWVNRSGTMEPAGTPLPIQSSLTDRDFRLSPDGRFVAYASWEGGPPDLWVYDLVSGARTRLTTNAGVSSPVWVPNEARVVFTAFLGERQRGLYSRRADGTADVVAFPKSTEFRVSYDASPDGKWLVYGEGVASSVLWVRPIDGSVPARAIVSRSGRSELAVISPDQKWMAYVANDSGRPEVFVQPFPSGEGRWSISTDGGIFPMWSRNGQELELLFRTDNHVMSASSRVKDGRFESGAPRPLFDAGVESGLSRSFEVGRDGRLLMVHTSGQDRITIVLNLQAELAKLAAAGTGR